MWLGSPARNESPRFWVTTKREVGNHCMNDPAHGTSNTERRIQLKHKDPKLIIHDEWENDWALLEDLLKG